MRRAASKRVGHCTACKPLTGGSVTAPSESLWGGAPPCGRRAGHRRLPLSLPCSRRGRTRIGGRRPPAGHHMQDTLGHTLGTRPVAATEDAVVANRCQLVTHPPREARWPIGERTPPRTPAIAPPVGWHPRMDWHPTSLPGPPRPQQALGRRSHACANPRGFTGRAGLRPSGWPSRLTPSSESCEIESRTARWSYPPCPSAPPPLPCPKPVAATAVHQRREHPSPSSSSPIAGATPCRCPSILLPPAAAAAACPHQPKLPRLLRPPPPPEPRPADPRPLPPPR